MINKENYFDFIETKLKKLLEVKTSHLESCSIVSIN